MRFLVSSLCSCVTENIESTERKASVHALVLYCLEPLITDTTVEHHIVEYISDITVNTLKSFHFTDWRIRNAALQTFGAISNKLLGNNLSTRDETTQQSTVCVEELFFKYPNIYSCILHTIQSSSTTNNANLNALIPIFTFLARSYVRGDSYVLYNEVHEIPKLSYITNYIMEFITHVNNNSVAEVASLAFVAIIFHKDIINNIIQINNNIGGVKLNEFYSLIYTIKKLSDKLLEDADILPEFGYKYELSKLISELNLIIDRLSCNPIQKTISQLLLYQRGMETVKLKDVEKLSLLIFTRPNMKLYLPGFLFWMEHKLVYIFNHEKMDEIVDLIKLCLIKAPIFLTEVCLKCLKDRINKCKLTKCFCENNLINDLVGVLFNEKFARFRFVQDSCIDVLNLLKLKVLNDTLKIKFIENVNGFQEQILPYYYMPLFCAVYSKYFKDVRQVKYFFNFCIDQCYQTLENDKDLVILKSVNYICKFAYYHKDDDLIVKVMKVIYKMLQIGNTDLNDQCINMISFCFAIKAKHAYACIQDLVNRQNLLKIMKNVCIIKFLIEIYSEQNIEKVFNFNVFEEKHTLCIETYLIRDIIKENITSSYTNLDMSEREEFFTWFSEFEKKNSANEFINVLKNLFNEK